MNHIAATRLMQLCAEAIVQDEQESDHLRSCQECRTLLRKFGEERSKALLRKTAQAGKDDDTLTKSA